MQPCRMKLNKGLLEAFATGDGPYWMQAKQNPLADGNKQLTGASDALEGPGAGAGAASSLRPLAADMALAGARYALEGPGAGAGAIASR